MPIVAYSRKTISPAKSFRESVEKLGSFPFFEMSLDTAQRTIAEIIYCRPTDDGHLEEISGLIKQGYEPLSPLELANCSEEINRRMMHVEHESLWAVVSKYPCNNQAKDECLLILFKYIEQIHLEYLRIPKRKRKRRPQLPKNVVFVLAKKEGETTKLPPLGEKKKR